MNSLEKFLQNNNLQDADDIDSLLELAEMVRKIIRSKNGFLNMLSKKDNMLLSVHGQTLHMDIYNPTLAAIANLSMLASSEGLFMRRSEN